MPRFLSRTLNHPFGLAAAIGAVFIWALVHESPAAAAVRYVDASAAGANNGTSWPNAFTNLQSALGAAVAGDEIWVAAATYKPAGPNGARTIAFALKNGTTLYGGFPVGGGTLLQRDPALNPTILSGDLNGNDGPNFANYNENSLHVVTSTLPTLVTVMDGFTITSGNADGANVDERRGGGAYFQGNDQIHNLFINQCTFAANKCFFSGGGAFANHIDVQVLHCTFVNNHADDGGGGFSSTSAAPSLSACTFQGNVAVGRGGGIYFTSAIGGTSILDSTFQNNASTLDGGGLFYGFGNANLVVTVRNCVFENNSAVPAGSGAANGGGLAILDSRLQVSACRFANNSAYGSGGGAYLKPGNTGNAIVGCEFLANHATLFDGGGCAFPAEGATFANDVFDGNTAVSFGGGLSIPGSGNNRTVVDCTFAANTSSSDGGGVFDAGNDVFANSIFWNNVDTGGSGQAAQLKQSGGAIQVNYCCVQGWTGSLGGLGNHGLNPQFIDADGSDNVPGTDDDDLRLVSGSPAIDAAKNALVPLDATDIDEDGDVNEQLPLDIAGVPRFSDDPATPDSGNGTPPIVDMGAREFGEPLVYVTYIGPPGGSWFNQFNWSGGEVPDDQTNVILLSSVMVRSDAAVARDVVVKNGATLTISTGSLTAQSVLVQPGGSVSLNSASALLDVHSLNVQAGATLQWPTGTIAVSGGGLASTTALNVGCSGVASLILDGGAVVNAPSLQVCTQGTLKGNGTVMPALTNAGHVRPGLSAGTLTIVGAYTQTATGILDIELGGYQQGVTFDWLKINGQANLNGTVSVTLLPAFLHEVGEIQTYLSASSILGAFAVTSLPGLPGNAHFISQSSTTSRSLLTMLTQTGSRLYVNANASAGGNAQSWAGAARTLQGALEVAAFFPGQVDDIWVAAATYRPTKRLNALDSLSATFNLLPDVAVYGGFDGTESSLSERDWIANQTVLSGDVNGDDGPNFANNGENLTHVVRAIGADLLSSCILDGFTISGGNAAGGTGDANSGGGIIARVGSPTLRNLTLTANSANGGGGGLYMTCSSIVENCQFIGNRSFNVGGGAFLDLNVTPVLRGCRFEGNQAKGVPGGTGGGLVCNADHSYIVDCEFINNVAEATFVGGGGAACSGEYHFFNCRFLGNHTRGSGGGLNLIGTGNPVVANCLFSGNTAGVGYPLTNSQDGGGVFASTNVLLLVSNCAFNGNVATSVVGGLKSTSSAATKIVNTVFWNNGDSAGSGQAAQIGGSGPLQISYCDVQGWNGSLGGAGNFAADPLFVDSDGSDNTVGTEDDDLHVQALSPCIDAGNNAGVPFDSADLDDDGFTTDPLPIDLDGHVRFFDEPSSPDTGSGTAPLVDMGAFEHGAPLGEAGTYVGPPGGSWFTATNWAGGAVPGAQTDVFIGSSVVIDQNGALAHFVTVRGGGLLNIRAGSLTAQSALVRNGGTLKMSDPSALLSVTSLALEAGATLQWDAGTIQVLGSFVSSAPVSIGCAGAANLLLAAATVTAPEIDICSMGAVQGTGTLTTNVSNGGEIRPGASPGALSIAGNYVQTPGGILRIEVAGYSPATEYDVLTVTGAATLGGTLLVSTLNGFQPVLATVTFLTAGAVNGNFASASLPPLSNGFNFVLQTSSLSSSLLTVPPGRRLYVNGAAGPNGQATSWADATSSLSLAAQAARLSNGSITEIWVAQGTYVPTEETNPNDSSHRTATLVLVSGLGIYGGFAGGESDLSQRDFVNNVTIISGDVNGNDGPNFTNRSDNLYRVVSGNGVNATCVLDGFTIRSGNAVVTPRNGAGLYCNGGNPTVRNCTITDNFATDSGGGIFHSGDPMSLTNCHFTGNATPECSCGQGGGAIANMAASSATFTDCTFTGNTSELGGGLWNDVGGAITLTNCSFTGNKARGRGAAITSFLGVLTLTQCSFDGNGPLSGIPDTLVGGGAYIEGGAAALSSCQFTNNIAYISGAIHFVHNIGANVSLGDCTFTSNTVTQTGGAVGIDPAVQNSSASPTFTNCTFNNNSAGIRGGALYIFHQLSNQVNPIFTGCSFTGNSSGEGGAMACTVGITTNINGPKLNSCTFQGNSATTSGGAIRNEGGAITLAGTSFSNNSAPLGKAVYNVFKGTIRGDAAFLNGDGMESTDAIKPGQLSPGPQTATFTMHGPLKYSDRGPDFNDQPSLSIDIGGTTAGAGFDAIDASQGSAALTGGLFVNFINGFQPQLGDSFEIINSPSITGQFNVALFPPMPAGLLMSANYGARGVILKVEQIQSAVAFADPSINGLAGIPSSGALGDVDNDGDADLFICIPAAIPTGNGSAYILKNGGVDGSGNWLGFTSVTGPIALNVGPVDLTLGHFDSDAFLDFAVANQAGNRVLKFKNNGAGGFGAPIVITITAPTAVAAGQLFNAQDSVVITTVSGSVSIRHFNASGALLATQTTLTAGIAPDDVLVADVDHDADNDIVVLNKGDVGNPVSKISVHVNDADNSVFLAPAFYALGTGANSLVNDDLNGDGWTDLVASNTGDGTMSVLMNKADGAALFASAVNVPVGSSPTSVTTLDVEPDGDIDVVVVARNESNEPVVRLARNDINGGQTVVFTQFSDLVAGEQSVLARSADLNFDGVNDVVTINQGTPGLAPGSPGSVSSRLNIEPPSCPTDIAPPGGDHVVNVADLLLIINSWGPCPGCPADIAPPPPAGGNGIVNAADLLAVINSWGQCP